jgi:hypothetical protein
MTERKNQISVNDGKKIIRDLQNRSMGGHVRNTVNNDVAELNSARLRALNGLCGNCVYLTVFRKNQDNKVMASLDCGAHKDPVDLYMKTELGEKAECASFEQKKD